MTNGYTNSIDNGLFSPGKAARKIFSRTLLPLVFFFIACYAAAFIIEFIVAIMFPYKIEEIFTSPYFSIAINTVAMYGVGFPVFLLSARKMGCEPSAPEKQKITPKAIIVLFLIGEGFMFVGSLIGNALNAIIGAFTGSEIENGIESLITGTPLWLILAVVVVIGPVIEEIMFRKVIIDRLMPTGELSAVIFSGIAFGLFHGNLYQLFYATLLGFILGYIYVKTGRLIFPIIIHVVINFLGSALPMLLSDVMIEYEDMLLAMELGEAVNNELFTKYSMIILLYMLFQYGVYLLGIALAIYCMIKHRPSFRRGALMLSPLSAASSAVFNLGAILFLGISVLSIILNILPV